MIGGGPAGLMAAEAAMVAGAQVEVFDAMASCGRKFLLAGKGGLNLTHSEDGASFRGRYGERSAALELALRDFDAAALVRWAGTLGIATRNGSSGRVFPADFKAAPLLRRWLARLRAGGVEFHMRHRWHGFDPQGALLFGAPEGEIVVCADATVLALGGASWARLGSDGAWIEPLRALGVEVRPLRPTNCGFECAWSVHMMKNFAGAPVKNVDLSCARVDGGTARERGEFIVTATGIEGGGVYSLSPHLRDSLERDGACTLYVDLTPERTLARLSADLSAPRGSHTLAYQLERKAGLRGVKAALLYEMLTSAQRSDPTLIARTIKALPIKLSATRPLDEAISTAGGVAFEALDQRYMLSCLPGVFCAGEMLDWEAPTGGYLLTACFATGRAAGIGAVRWLAENRELSV